MREMTTVSTVPDILCCTVEDYRLHFDPVLQFTIDGVHQFLRLTGIVYGGEHHFTSSFVDALGKSWFHDGMSSGSICNAHIVPDPRVAQDGRRAVMVIYSKIIT